MRNVWKKLLLVESKYCRAKVHVDGSQKYKTYTGALENSSKTRFYSHQNSFRYPENMTMASFAKHIWELKENDIYPFHVTWEILINCEVPLVLHFNIIYTWQFLKYILRIYIIKYIFILMWYVSIYSYVYICNVDMLFLYMYRYIYI